MAIQPLSETAGFTPLETEQPAIPAAAAPAGSSPAVSGGGGGFTPEVQSPVPGEVLKVEASNLRPDTDGGGSQLENALSDIIGSLSPEDNPALDNTQDPSEPTLLADIEIDTYVAPAEPTAAGETPSEPDVYRSVLGSAVARAPVNVQVATANVTSFNGYDSVIARKTTPTPTSTNPRIRYTNQSATRNQPLSRKLERSMGFLDELGIDMEVFSGGQPAKGTSTKRVGSERHDHGDSADVFFYKDGRKLNWANEKDRPIFQEIVRRGKAAGITGFGAGPGYMSPGAMHLGFGAPLVWGAGGRAKNAPQWLRDAYGG